MPRLTAVVTLAAVITSACTSATSAETLSLAEELAPIAAEANAAVASLEHTIAQRYDDRSQLYDRVVDLRLPTTFAILIDKAQRVEAPPGTEAELDRYIGFLGDMLTASEHMDGAIAAADLTDTAIAAVEFDAAIGALAALLPTGSCPTLSPRSGRDLCDPGDLEGYEALLGFQLRSFIAAFRPPFRLPDAIGDVVRGRVLATLRGEVALVLDDTAGRLAGMDPGTTYIAFHRVLLDYFAAVTAKWNGLEIDPGTADPLLYDLIVADLKAERVAARALLAAELELILASAPESRITVVTNLWFPPAGLIGADG